MMTPESFSGPRAFARHMLAGGRLTLNPVRGSIRAFGGIALECVVFKESCWQVELITMLPNVVIPRHKHMRVSSVDLALGLGDDGHGVVGNAPMPQVQRGSMLSNLLRIDKGAWHEGVVSSSGVMFLSFQQWDGEPALISQDWVTE